MIDTKLKVGDIIVVTDSETVNYLQVGKVVNIRPYVVEYNLSDVNYAGEYSHCHLHITTECYDESLPRKSIILYREEE